MRTFIIENARLWGMTVHVERITVEQLLAADEVFLSNSVNLIWPICELDSTRFTVGEVTCLLQDKVVEKMYQNA
jgi:4-amino-4-deoxychorismate lyase